MAALTWPLEEAEVTVPTPIVAVATDDHLLEAVVRVVDARTEVPVMETVFTAPASTATVATFDPTLLENGLHRVELEVRDLGGAITRAERVVWVEGG